MEISWDRKEHLGLLEENEMAGVWQAGQSKTYTDGSCHRPAHPSLGLMSVGAQGCWVLGHGDWRSDFERRLLLDERRQDEGPRIRKYNAGNAYGGNLDCHRRKALLLSEAQGMELSFQSPPTHTHWPLPTPTLGPRKGPQGG